MNRQANKSLREDVVGVRSLQRLPQRPLKAQKAEFRYQRERLQGGGLVGQVLQLLID
ncbi:MAG: hypothetical protein LM555_01695 [Desulfurococcaceae archaeon]|nr:hypothetical protein [Desulfurococcaceae archaeon]